MKLQRRRFGVDREDERFCIGSLVELLCQLHLFEDGVETAVISLKLVEPFCSVCRLVHTGATSRRFRSQLGPLVLPSARSDVSWFCHGETESRARSAAPSDVFTSSMPVRIAEAW